MSEEHRTRHPATGIAISERLEDGVVRGAYISIFCSACGHGHGALPLNVNGRGDGWVWHEESLTLTPSVRHFHRADPEENIPETTLCHYNINGGRILYHADSTDHAVRGEHDMQPFPENYGFPYGT